MGEMMGFEAAPDCFDVVAFGRLCGRSRDAAPRGAGNQHGPGRLAGMDRSVVEHDDHVALALTGFGAVVMIEVLHKGREVGAAPGFGGGDDQPVGGTSRSRQPVAPIIVTFLASPGADTRRFAPCAIRALVRPSRVTSSARARSASAQSASAQSAPHTTRISRHSPQCRLVLFARRDRG